jgi:hypothetical protein
MEGIPTSRPTYMYLLSVLQTRCAYAPQIRRHANIARGLAYGTLVYLAKREFLSVILTVEHADFATYRIEGKRQFRVLPANHL